MATAFAAGVALFVAFLPAINQWRNKAILEIEFEQREPFCREAPLVLSVEPTAAGDMPIVDGAYFVRLRIHNRGRRVARKVEGRLEAIANLDGTEQTDFDPVVLHWVGRDTPGPIDINKSESEYLDVLYLRRTKPRTWFVNAERTLPRGISLERHFPASIPGSPPLGSLEPAVRLQVTIYGEELTPVGRTITALFSDDWDRLLFELRNREEEPIVRRE